MMFVPSVIVAFSRNRPAVFPTGLAEPYLPLGLLGISLLLRFHVGGRKSTLFQPAGGRFPFPAPFERRELLHLQAGEGVIGLVLRWRSSFRCLS